MKTFETYEEVDGMAPCVKKPVAVHAKQVHEDFRVNTLEGDYKQGKAGDYLVKGVDGELYINDKDIFEKTYDFAHYMPTINTPPRPLNVGETATYYKETGVWKFGTI
jgi:hypothetical protein